MTDIRFGTSGWRAIIADEFTYDNVRRVLDALVLFIRNQKNQSKPVIIASDARFMNDMFRNLAAKHLAERGVNVWLTDEPTPTPVVSHAIRKNSLAGGINFTASHNPPEYQGIKFSPENGAPAPSDVTDMIVSLIDKPVSLPEKKGIISACAPKNLYFDTLESLVNFKQIANENISIACDLLYGAGRGYLDLIFRRNGCEVTTFHDETNPLFGGKRPEPAPENIAEMIAFMKNGKADIGIATDGDADRFGIVDNTGEFYSPNRVLCLAAWHQIKNRGKKGRIVRTVATTCLLDRLASALGAEITEVPVGFKFIGPHILDGDVIVGGEESGGLSISGHIPEKDGILACALIAELVASEKKPLADIWRDIEMTAGSVWNTRKDITLSLEKKQRLLLNLDKIPETSFAGRTVMKFNGVDGYKYTFSKDEWVLIRPSGTEPVLRCYLEAATKEKGELLTNDVMKTITSLTV
jgi:phosphomannomutase